MHSNLRRLLLTGLFGWAACYLPGAKLLAQAQYCGVRWEQCVTTPGCSFSQDNCGGGYCDYLCSCEGTYKSGSCICEGGCS
jgi:hypothetical protein